MRSHAGTTEGKLPWARRLATVIPMKSKAIGGLASCVKGAKPIIVTSISKDGFDLLRAKHCAKWQCLPQFSDQSLGKSRDHTSLRDLQTPLRYSTSTTPSVLYPRHSLALTIRTGRTNKNSDDDVRRCFVDMAVPTHRAQKNFNNAF